MVIARLMIVMMAAVWAGACASGGRTLADRFVIQGTPAMDIGGPRLVSARIQSEGPAQGQIHQQRGVPIDWAELGGRIHESGAEGCPVQPAARSDGGSPPAGGARLSRHRHFRHGVRVPGQEPHVERSGPGSARRRGPVVARLGTAGQRSLACLPSREPRARLGRGAEHAGHPAVPAGPPSGCPGPIRNRGAAGCKRRLCFGKPLHPDAGRGPDTGGHHLCRQAKAARQGRASVDTSPEPH